MMTQQKLPVIELLSISTLRPDPANPRRHSPRQIKQIARSIKTFGFNVPVLVDQLSQILAGHGRTLAAQSLGFTELPAVRLEHLSEMQARAFRIADNRLTDTSDWDDRLLAAAFKDLTSADLSFDLEATGFSTSEIDLRIEGLPDANDGDTADNLPAPTTQQPVSKMGDVWQLGRHRIIGADARDAKTYAELMPNERATMVFTDPPYNVKISGHASGLGQIQHREFAMAAGEMTQAEFTEFLTTVINHLVRLSVDGAIHYVCIDWRHAPELLAAGKAIYSELKNICVWAKHNAGMGSFYRSQHEFVFVYKAGRGPYRNNIELGRNGRHRSNVWQYPAINSFGRSSDEGNLAALHPTVKPVRLIADAILDCSARNDIVLDAFLGSGSTLIAAERTGRRCFGIEIDPLYIDTAIRRWQAYAGAQAIHASSGQSFQDRAGAAQ
jgi:DNA modification methylase